MSAPVEPHARPALLGAVGVLLAAGAGRRMGRPKALMVASDGEPWLARGVRILQEAGCGRVIVVLGADAARARALFSPTETERTSAEANGTRAHDANADDPTALDAAAPPSSRASTAVTVAVAEDWLEGIGASLRTGLAQLAGIGARFAVVTLVDLPELREAAVRRVASGATESSLRQAFYDGRPGHPVLIGAAHFAPLAAALHGDTGAQPYLVAHGFEAVDCTDLGGGDDVDRPLLRDA